MPSLAVRLHEQPRAARLAAAASLPHDSVPEQIGASAAAVSVKTKTRWCSASAGARYRSLPLVREWLPAAAAQVRAALLA